MVRAETGADVRDLFRGWIVDGEVTAGVGPIEIEGAGNKSFSDAGDSGSLIVDDEMLAAALLFAGGDHGGSNGKGLTYANPIAAVLKSLKVKLA